LALASPRVALDTFRDRTTAVLDDPDVRGRFERTVARTRARERFRPKEFSRIQVNDRFRAEEHKRLMHQQVWGAGGGEEDADQGAAAD